MILGIQPLVFSREYMVFFFWGCWGEVFKRLTWTSAFSVAWLREWCVEGFRTFPETQTPGLRGLKMKMMCNYCDTPSILTPQRPGYIEDLYTPVSYRFRAPSIGGSQLILPVCQFTSWDYVYLLYIHIFWASCEKYNPHHVVSRWYAPLKTNMTMEYPPFEDVSPMKNGNIPAIAMLVYQRGYCVL